MVFTDTVYASESSGYAGSENAGALLSSGAEQEMSGGEESVASALSQKDASDQEDRICVFVCGAVNCEGVYELPADARVIDAVQAAGGYRDDADQIYINQAEYVYDTQRIEIPTEEEAEVLREKRSEEEQDHVGQAVAQQEEDLININTADKQELMKIPGIGESKAERIIEYRELHGRFGSTEELMNVSGIGSGIFENMKDSVTVK